MLHLDDNDFVRLSGKINQLKKLKTLSLGNNRLTAFPKEILELDHLEMLFLENNRLSIKIDPPLNPEKLIDIAGRTDEQHPDEAAQLRSLYDLSKTSGELTTLPQKYWTLSRMEQLDLGLKLFTSLPPEAGNLSNLKRIQIHKNQYREDPIYEKNPPKLTDLILFWKTLT